MLHRLPPQQHASGKAYELIASHGAPQLPCTKCLFEMNKSGDETRLYELQNAPVEAGGGAVELGVAAAAVVAGQVLLPRRLGRCCVHVQPVVGGGQALCCRRAAARRRHQRPVESCQARWPKRCMVLAMARSAPIRKFLAVLTACSECVSASNVDTDRTLGNGRGVCLRTAEGRRAC